MKRQKILLFLMALFVVASLFQFFKSNTLKSPPNENKIVASKSAPSKKSFRATRSLEVSTTNEFKKSESASDEDQEWIKLSREQVEAYLLKTKRSPESLLNAFSETGDTNFLHEAAEKFPDNPIVQWVMVSNASLEERAQWLEKLKTSSPDNALPNYLSALDKFKAGNAEQALGEIDSASKKNMSAYERERMQSREEMYLLSGYSPFEAKEKGFQMIDPAPLPEMKQLAWQIDELQKKYKAAGDNDSNQQLAIAGIEAARKYSEDKTQPTLIHQRVGIAMENIALRNLDAGTYYDFLGKTAGERLQETKKQNYELMDLAKTQSQNYLNLSEPEKTIYLNRVILNGELNAMLWLRNYPSQTK